MDEPTLSDFESVEDISEALELLTAVNKDEAEVKGKEFSEYGEIVTSLI